MVFYIGQIASGCVAKLVNNMLALVNSIAVFEGMLLGTKAGVEPYILYDIYRRAAAPGVR